MEKIRLTQAVLCEGKYDKIKLSSVIDGVIITTDGFSVFNNSEKRAMIKKLCEARGLVIITDSDRAGLFIRSKLKGMLPADRVKHVYIPEIRGRERRKTKDSKDGLLGVEGISTAQLRKVFEKAGLCEDITDVPRIKAITKAQLYSLGLSGGENSAQAREYVCSRLELPRGLSSNALLCACEMLGVSFSSLENIVSEKAEDEQNV